MKQHFRFICLFVALAGTTVGVLTFCPAALADDASVPDEAGREQVGQAESFREEAQSQPDETPVETPHIEQAEAPEAPVEEDEGPRFLVREIRFEGNTLFPASDFTPYTAPYSDQTISLRALKFVAKAVTNHYRSRGYINSRAYIKPQKIENGVVTVQVIEARLGKTIVEGNRHFSTRLFEDMTDLPRDKAFRYSELENRLRFINRNPDFHAAAFLTPGEATETSDLRLKIEDKFPLHAYYEFNNHGTKLTHRSRHLITGIHNNFLGRADTLAVTEALSEQGAFDAFSGGWSVPLWRTGTTFQLSGSYVDSLLVKHLKSSEITGLSWSVTPAVTQELLATPDQQLSFYAGLEIKDSKSSVNDFTSSLDRMRVLVAGPRWTLMDPAGRTSLAGELHWGIPDFLGGSEDEDLNASRPRSGGDFIYYTGSAVRLQRLPFGWTWMARGSGQWSDGALTSLEQIRIGGYSSVRGYPESDSAGDYGLVGVNEVFVPLPAPDAWRVPFTDERLDQVVRMVGFFDAGKVFTHTRNTSTDVKDRMLMGAGAGVRVNLKKNVSAQFDYAWPLGDDSTDQRDQPQVHFSIRSGF